MNDALLAFWRRPLQWLRARLAGLTGQVPNDREDAGRWGEAVAADWLRRQGYTILGRRVRPNRRDELDLVARRGDTLVFVEVKTRRSERFGRPAAAVDRRKRHSLCRAAARYLRRLRYPALFYRFDVIEVVGRQDETPVIRHIEDAFRPDPRRFRATPPRP
ncbi:MAG: YraN family protein [Kiritimatiellae bacterium]|nr:YraN family protein [Kiritimatiellia bacterium]